jgi:hypothetical protein
LQIQKPLGFVISDRRTGEIVHKRHFPHRVSLEMEASFEPIQQACSSIFIFGADFQIWETLHRKGQTFAPTIHAFHQGINTLIIMDFLLLSVRG